MLVRPQKQISLAKIETGFLLCEIGCGDSARVICLFARGIQQLRLRTQKIQANVDHCCLAQRIDVPMALHSALDSSIQDCAD